MLVETPEIQLHGLNTKSDPIYSVHVQPRSKICLKNGKRVIRIATSGITEIRLWIVTPGAVTNDKLPQLEFRSTLQRHESAINIVRFSPDGLRLASGDVDGVVLLWKLVDEQVKDPKTIPTDELGTVNLETWNSTSLKKHATEVTDLFWSPDGRYLVSTSLDDSSNIYDIEKGSIWKTITDAKHYVLGVSWDPLSRYVATLSADKALRLYNPFGDTNTAVHKITHLVNGVNTEQMFLGEGNCMARRRLDFSPDGCYLVAPTGAYKPDKAAENNNRIACSYVFGMANRKIGNPVAILPAMAATSLVRFCPVLFQHRTRKDENNLTVDLPSTSDSSAMDVDDETLRESISRSGDNSGKHRKMVPDSLAYRMVFAVASAKHIALYDTDMERPFAVIDQIHAADISDLAWTTDGLMLIVSSLDGYLSFIEFSTGELGDVYVAPVPVPVEPKVELVVTAGGVSATSSDAIVQ